MMFVSSFVIIELLSFFSTFEERNTIPATVGYLKVEGVTIEEEGLRFKSYGLMKFLE